MEGVVGAENWVRNIHVNADFKVRRVLEMSDVLITVKILPESADVDIEELIKKIEGIDVAKFNSLEKEPIAFGLVALNASFITEDRKEGVDEIEEALKKIEGVGVAEVVEATRLL